MRQLPDLVSSRRKLSTNSLAKGFFLLLAVVAAPAQAAFVTLHEARVNQIYSQESFTTNPIDINYIYESDGSIKEYVAPELLIVENGTEFSALVNADLGLADTTIPLFYIDRIDWCGGGSAKGCANSSGAIFESITTGRDVGGELIAHEIGHVLGLSHPDLTADQTDGESDNLMNRVVAHEITDVLVATQITSIFNNPYGYVLGNAQSGFYLDLAPVLVVAAASVPVPGALVLMLGTLVPLGAMRRASRNS